MGHQFGFVRVIDDDPFDGWNYLTLPLRSPELVERAERFAEERRKAARRNVAP